jgi:hypothetical protein
MKINKAFIFILPFAFIAAIVLFVFDIRLDDNAYDVLLKNRFTGLGYGIDWCGNRTATPQKQCMKDHRSSFEIWDFAHTVHGGIAENRFYPPLP